MSVVAHLASPRLTLLGMAVLGAGVAGTHYLPEYRSILLAAPMLLLAVNLLASLATRTQFRRQPALLVFHLCLLVILLLTALGQLTFFKGRIEIAEGQVFDPGAVTVTVAGPWHDRRLERLEFEQGAIRIEYAPNLRRGRTESRIRTLERDARPREVVVGDDDPLIVAGYRFYTTPNKGYAAALSWSAGGETRAGFVHFPAYPLHDWKQINEWQTPGGQRLQFELPSLPPVPANRAWVLSSATAEATLELRVDGRSLSLRPGESVSLGSERLRFDGVRLWMGYAISYDPTLPWLLASSLFGVFALAWHFARRYGNPPPAAEREPRSAAHVHDVLVRS